MWTDAMHTLSGDTGFPVHYQQSWLWTACAFSFSFFKKAVVDQSHFLKCPTVNKRVKRWSLWGRLSLESTKQKKLSFQKCSNDPQKRHWVQHSVIIFSTSTMYHESKYSPMSSLVAFQPMKESSKHTKTTRLNKMPSSKTTTCIQPHAPTAMAAETRDFLSKTQLCEMAVRSI